MRISDLATFIGKEVTHDNRYFKSLKTDEVELLITHGDVLGPLVVRGKDDRSGNLILEAKNVYFSRFRAGDTVEITVIDPATKRFVHKAFGTTKVNSVRFPAPGVLQLLVPGKSVPLQSGIEVFALPTSMGSIKKQMAQKLRDQEHNPIRLEKTVINNLSIKRNFYAESEKLNKTQKEALRFLIDNDMNGLVQGPPGTGKTHLLVSLIRTAINSGLRVGLGSLAHSAVDNALSKILKSGIDPSCCARVAGERNKVVSSVYSPIDIESLIVKSLGECDEGKQLYAATMHSWVLSNRLPEIDLLVIDEASQVPIYFYPLLEKICARIIMFGDHKQLPPVIQISTHELPNEDIFSYTIERGKYPMLEVQYRMNENIQDWSSNRFYGGKLQPDESVRHRDVLRGVPSPSSLIGKNIINMINHGGSSVNLANIEGAKKVADLVWALKSEGRLPLDEIGIVAPHRAHAGAICAELQQRIGIDDAQKILVDTVERFQGQEREAMIFSLSTDKDEPKRGDRAFLGDGRRLNVAVTRAKSRFYCLAPGKLVDQTMSAPGDDHLKSMFSWCGAVTRPVKERVTIDTGYVKAVYDSGHEEYEHRALAQKILGRRLYADEDVHHMNGQRDDNRPENLCVLTKKNHEEYHKWYEWVKNKHGISRANELHINKLVKDFNGILLGELANKKASGG